MYLNLVFLGMCIKSVDKLTGKKVFVNLCKSGDVPEPEYDYPDDHLANILANGTDEENASLRMPMSIGEKREEKDNKGNPCFAVDVIINSKLFEERILVSEVYRTFLIVISMEGIDEKLKFSLEKSNYTILSHKKSVGKLAPQFVRAKPQIVEMKSPTTTTSGQPSRPIMGSSSLITPISMSSINGNTKKLVEEVATNDSQLECTITQSSCDAAKAEIKIPKLRNPKKLTVTLGADRIIVDSPVGSLDIFVPVDIHQEECRAEYNVESEVLTLHLPLIEKL